MNETLDRTEVETSKWSSIIDRVWSEWPEKSGKRIPDKDDNDVGAISYLIEKERKNKKKALTEKEVVTIVELYLTTLTKKVLSTQDKTTRAVMLAGILAMGLILVWWISAYLHRKSQEIARALKQSNPPPNVP